MKKILLLLLFIMNRQILQAQTSHSLNSEANLTQTVLPVTQDSILDIDGNVYHTVSIGKQVWMAENLKTTRYNDGTIIPNITDSATWRKLTSPGYCFFNYKLENKDIYGALYNWYCIDTKKLCPLGWHVPTDQEWNELSLFLGGQNGVGGKLKKDGNIFWRSPNTGATNSSNFNALPGGNCSDSGEFYYLGYYGGWWTSTEFTTNRAWYRSMSYLDSNLFRNFFTKGNGFSVRCIHD